MSFPSPSERQARILWTSLTTLAICILVLLLGLVCWGLGWVINRLYAVLLPLAIAGIIAYLLDPLVDFFESRNMPRGRAIIFVFFLGLLLLVLLLATALPQLLQEIGDLIEKLPVYAKDFRDRITVWLSTTRAGARAKEMWELHGETVQGWVTRALPGVSTWALNQTGRVASWFGLLIGFALVPIYAFYFLVEKRGIQTRWTDYLPVQESFWKEELVFFIKSVNDSLIVFFRGQVLVAMCVGALTALGFMLIKLKYALLLGVMTGLLGIVPYLGVMVSIVPAIILGVAQFGDWRVILVVGVFALVQMAEGLVISPKIIGDRVGLHPMTIIIAVMVGTTLMGGILGGVLAIPLTAVFRTLMFRYIWRKKHPGYHTEQLTAALSSRETKTP